jgi:7,8-dihydropterin-6-yl-methyl-4-(beta-D-ribofuranosyl)aminobenzene 5'-phosphate synthase
MKRRYKSIPWIELGVRLLIVSLLLVGVCAIREGSRVFGASREGPSLLILYDNYPFREGLRSSWGFSCLVRGMEKVVLFDTGGNGSMLRANMEKLGVDPDSIEVVVLSHCHQDHVGGLPSLLRRNPKVTVYLPAAFPASYKKKLRDWGARVVDVSGPRKICAGVYTTGEMGEWIREQSLAVRTEKGLIVVTGCAHPGITNIIERAKGSAKADVLLVLGGFHLLNLGKADVLKVISAFKKLGVRYAGPSHCSGDLTRRLFKEAYGRKCLNVGVGREIRVNALN